MIGSLRGTVLARDPGELLVEVAGIGYRVQVTPATAAEAAIGGEVLLHVHHHRRDDGDLLYGFPDADQRRVFETLIATHGVGPALGLAILAVHTPSALVDAVAAEDAGALCLVPGVGRKTAARLLVELGSRLSVPVLDVTVPGAAGKGSTGGNGARADVREALTGLGYGAEEIGRVLAELGTDAEKDAPTSELLRDALRRLAVA